MLAFTFSRSRRIVVTAFPSKGVTEFGARICERFTEKTTVKGCINFSDFETAIMALKDAAARALPFVEACPVGDHQSHGSIQVSVGELKTQMRAIRMQLERRLDIVLANDAPILA